MGHYAVADLALRTSCAPGRPSFTQTGWPARWRAKLVTRGNDFPRHRLHPTDRVTALRPSELPSPPAIRSGHRRGAAPARLAPANPYCAFGSLTLPLRLHRTNI